MIGPVNSRDDVADGSELDAAARREGQSENGKVHVDLPRRLAKPTRCQKELRIIREGTVRAALSNTSQQASEIDYRHQPCSAWTLWKRRSKFVSSASFSSSVGLPW
jgi:hypothetical protein